MANQYDDFEDDDFEAENNNGPAELRKALKRAEKERKELEKQLNEIKTAQREQSVKSVLESKGISAKIAKFIPSDVSTPDQVEAWISEYSDVFNISTAETPQEDSTPDPRAMELARMNNAVRNAKQEISNPEDLARAVANVKSRAELDELTGNQPARFQR